MKRSGGMVEMTIDMEMTIESLATDRRSRQQMIWLRSVDGQMVIPIVIGSTEAMSIYVELTGERAPRPLTHDLLKNILDHFESQVQEVRIVDLKEGIFFAELILGMNGRQLRLDARPSDSIALALRYKAPVYMAEAILKEAGYRDDIGSEEAVPHQIDPTELEALAASAESEPVLEVDEEDEVEALGEAVDRLLDEIDPEEESGVKLTRDGVRERIELLKKKMERACKLEQYEEAGRLRDEIEKLIGSRRKS
jgi:bifunctional DNase/RNase